MRAAPPKDPRSTKWYEADFSDLLNLLVSGETIVSVVSAMTYFQGATIDTTPSTMLTGSTVINADGLSVTQLINGGFNGNVYIWTATATTSSGQILPLAQTVLIVYGIED